MSDEASVTLLIGSSSSRCSACNRNADPAEKAHDMVTMVGEGCGARFTHVANVYSEQGARVREMRPDLIFAGIDDATPPLVAASPVPPVVPDSDPVEALPAIIRNSILGASGSGVVPDKPALAPSLPAVEAAITAWNAAEPVHQVVGASFHASFIEMLRAAYSVDRPNASVPAVTDDAIKMNDLRCAGCSELPDSCECAVTDDEAATRVIALALSGLHGEPPDEWDEEYAQIAVAALRSAGFLIVHHTKET